MKRYLPSSTIAAALLAGALFASATGGAVAGSMITGKQIKNGSVTGKDLKDKSVGTADLAPGTVTAGPAGAAGPPGLVGLQTVTAEKPNIAAGSGGNFTITCPVGTSMLSAAALFESFFGSVGLAYASDHRRAFAFYINQSGATDQLTMTAVCATVAG
jgi:hypothetical protein